MENFAKIDFRTPVQIKREEARLKVCKVYQQTMKEAPNGTSRNRVITVVAYQLGMTVQGVKNILIRYDCMRSARCANQRRRLFNPIV